MGKEGKHIKASKRKGCGLKRKSFLRKRFFSLMSNVYESKAILRNTDCYSRIATKTSLISVNLCMVLVNLYA